ncbi:MAG: DUF6036 family nucleotidyltransferase [Proteobacteria bacterium]|nr:DUF6036 family nucleotidyltransferase [Pseudomonadota bacterium]
MINRINKQVLLEELGAWDSFLGRRVRLIACGGTAMTLIGVKDSTKDIDLMVPDESEYKYLLKTMKELGFKPDRGSGWSKGGGFIFDIFSGNKIHTTELLESPLEQGNHLPVKEFRKISLGVLNHYDLIISKLFRGQTVDLEDCLTLAKAKRNEIDLKILKNRYRETAKYNVSEERIMKNMEWFLERLLKEENGR